MAVTIPGLLTTGTIATTAEPANAVIDVLAAGLQAFAALSGGASWSIYQDQSAGPNRDYVFRSVGDPALDDRRIYTRARRTTSTTITHEAMLDWSTLSSTGRNTKPGSPAGLTTVADIDWWLVVNEYAYFMIIDSNGTWTTIYGGATDRSHLPRAHQGTCLSTAAVTAGANVIIPVNRDMTNEIEVGLSVDVVPLAAPGAALPTFNPERCVVAAVSATSITVSTLANNQPAGCAIGDDPCGTFTTPNNLATPNVVIARNLTFPAGTISGTIQWTFTEGDIDPDVGGWWRGSPLLWRDSTQGPRGTPWHIGMWPSDGTQSPARRYRHDYNDNVVWVQFPAIVIGTFFLGVRTGNTTTPVNLLLRGSDPVTTFGTIAAGGTTKNVESLAEVETVLLANGWTLYQDQGAGGGDLSRRVWRSTGVDNDTRVYVRLRAQAGGTNIAIEAYLDWSTASGTGRNLQSSLIGISNTTQVDWWISANEYECTFYREQSGAIDGITFGQTYRSHIPPRHRGTAFTTAAATAGANAVLSVDRDLTGQLQIGGPIDIVPIAEDGGALPTFLKERTTVVAVTTTTVTVATLANNQPSHCLIGDDPIPTFVNGVVSGTLTGANLYCLARTGTGTVNITNAFELNVAEGELDPDVVGYWYGTRRHFRSATAGLRGNLRTQTAWPTDGTIALNDGFRDFETGQLYLAHPSITGSNWILGLPVDSVSGTVRNGVLFETIVNQQETPLAGPTVSATYDDGVFHEIRSQLASVPANAGGGTYVVVVRQDNPVIGGTPSVARLGGDGVVLVTDATLVDTSEDEELVALTLPNGWSAAGTGTATATRAGVECAGTVVVSTGTFDSFDVRVDVDLVRPGGGVSSAAELAVLELVLGSVVARVAVMRGVGGNTDATYVLGQIDGRGYGVAEIDPRDTLTLRLVRDDTFVWGFVGDVEVLRGFVVASSGTLRFGVRALSSGSRIVSRFTNWEIRSCARFGAVLLADGLVVDRHLFAATAPAEAIGSETAVVFGLFGRVTDADAVEYAPLTSRAVAAGGALVAINDRAVRD